MNIQTKNQRLAQAAYQQVVERRPGREYASFAREFPALVHSCGLAQAVAFALSKKKHQLEYANDLAAVLTIIGHSKIASANQLSDRIREKDFTVTDYLRLSRDALTAATWLKRYVEAVGKD